MSAEPEERSESWTAISRRALLKAGWTAPVIMTVAPAVAFAASGGAGAPAQTTTARQPATREHTTKANSPSGGPGRSKAPQSHEPSSGQAGIPEEQSQGPQPARINRGFTG
jgi:hypothetical protein